NAHYIKHSSNADLVQRVAPRIQERGGNPQAVDLEAVMNLLKDRAETLNQLADDAMLFCRPFTPATPELQAEQLTDEAKALLADFARRATELPDWNSETLDTLIKTMLADHGVKMPKLGIPL